MRFAWSAVLLAGLAASAYADAGDGDESKPASAPGSSDQGDRIRKLEIEIEKLKAEHVREADAEMRSHESETHPEGQ